MAPADIQKEMLHTLVSLKQDIGSLKQDIDYIKEHIEDSQLSDEERFLLEKSITEVKSCDESNFVSSEDLKKQLGL